VVDHSEDVRLVYQSVISEAISGITFSQAFSILGRNTDCGGIPPDQT